MVQDLEPVVLGEEKNIAEDVKDHTQFMAHDFLTEKPVRGAGVYLLRWILHNWSDKYRLQILRSLVPALKTGAKILVNDNVLPPPGSLPHWKELSLRYANFYFSLFPQRYTEPTHKLHMSQS